MTVPLSGFLRGTSFVNRITALCVLLVFVALALFVWVVRSQFAASIQQQADALGETLIHQTARAAVTALATEDTLGLNILLRELVNSPYVSYAVLYSADNNVVAQAGTYPGEQGHNGRYVHQLTFQRVMAGTLQIYVDIGRLQQPMYKSLQSMVLFGLLILTLMAFLSYRLARSVSQPIRALNYWLEHPVLAAPHVERGDEIGQLARRLDELLGPPVVDQIIPKETAPIKETPMQPEPPVLDQAYPDTAPLPADSLNPPAADSGMPSVEPANTIVLAVQPNLSQSSGQLGQERLQQFLARYQQALQQAADLYHAQLVQLPDERSVLLFHDTKRHYVRYSLCCGELLRAFAHALQIDIADSSVTVSLQLGLAYGSALTGLSRDDLFAQKSVQSALELSGYSRNLLLLSEDLAQDSRVQTFARIRSIARPQGASCVECLLAPYPAQLDNQLRRLRALH